MKKALRVSVAIEGMRVGYVFVDEVTPRLEALLGAGYFTEVEAYKEPIEEVEAETEVVSAKVANGRRSRKE